MPSEVNLNRVPIFISSAHYGLQDLRGELTSFLENVLTTNPFISSEKGFQTTDKCAPFESCLRVLESCPIVIGILDRRYGSSICKEEWGRYRDYADYSPTHAEFEHAIKNKKKFIVFYRSDIDGFYEVYRRNGYTVNGVSLPKDLDEKTLKMFHDLRTRTPATERPWMEPFIDVRDIKISIQKRLLNMLYEFLEDQQRDFQEGTERIIESFLELDKDLKKEVLDKIDPQILKDAGYTKGSDKSNKTEKEYGDVSNLEAQRKYLLKAMPIVSAALKAEGLLATRASSNTLPSFFDQQLSVSGVWFTGYTQQAPTLSKVSWSLLNRRDRFGKQRGYDAGVQFFGDNFALNCRIEQLLPNGKAGRWHASPNLWSGHYMEVSTHTSRSAPFGYFGKKFRVFNPSLSKFSEWVEFSFDYIEEDELNYCNSKLKDAQSAYDSGDYCKVFSFAGEAEVILKAILGEEHITTIKAKNLIQNAQNKMKKIPGQQH